MNETEYTIDDVIEILIRQTKILARLGKTVEEIYKIQEEDSRLEGTSITNTFTLQTGQRVTKIDFVEAMHDGVPAGVTFDVPLKPVALLKISNLGPGLLLYSTNKALSQTEAAEQVLQGEHEYIKLKKRAIRHLNVVANTKPATVRVTAWI